MRVYYSGIQDSLFNFNPNIGYFYLDSSLTSTLIQEYNTNKELVKVIDFLGRETKGIKNEPFFYIYDDGTVEKRIILE